MPTTPLVSVIVPAYNAERYLPDCVSSVRRQTWSNLEVIIVNDGSSDATPVLAAGLEAEDSRIRVIHRKNGGLSSARNTGIAAARGELLCFLDADDIFLPDKIERQVAFLDLSPSCDLVYSDHYLGDDALNPILLECKRPADLPMRELLSYCNWFAPMSPLMRARLVERVGGFDEDLFGAEDWDFWIRASRCGVIEYLPGPVGVYRTHPGQMHHNHQRMRSNQDKVIRKHFERGSREWHNIQATRAWSEAKRSWAARRYLRTAAKIVTSAWHARTRARWKKVVALAG